MDAVVEIANSMRVAYFKSGSNPPPITDKRLIGRENVLFQSQAIR